METILNFLYIAGAVLFLFGAAVFVHEFGHFWVARRRGMKVEEFAIGFGPKLFSWTKDGVVYSWRAIPAGGFVKLPQMITSEALEGAKQSGEELAPASPLTKILVAFAGPFMNVVFAFVIGGFLYFVGLPMLVNPPIIGYVEPDSSEAKLGIQEGDRVVSVDGKRIKTWQDIQMAALLARTNMLEVVVDRAGAKSTYVLEAASNDTVGGKLLNLNPQDHPVILSVSETGAAKAAGALENDLVLSYGGVPVAGREQLIGLIQKTAGQASEMVVQRGKEKVKLTVTPNLDPGTKRGLIGVALGSKEVYEVQKPGPTPLAQVGDVLGKTIDTFSALWHSKETGVGAKDLSGPIGIFAILAKFVNTDYRLALSFLLLLNINLAILNLLPIPVLDGGHIVMSLIESATRKPLSLRFVEYTTTAFAVLLIGFMIYVSAYDVKRIPLFKAIFKQETQINQADPAPATQAGEPAGAKP